jgi:hypothetical protein
VCLQRKEYYTTTKRNKQVWIHTTTCMNTCEY